MQAITMSLHFSDESKAPRECPGCGACDTGYPRGCMPSFGGCDGSGRINADAQPDVEVRYLPLLDLNSSSTIAAASSDITAPPGFYWRTAGHLSDGPYPTVETALEAARRALEQGAGPTATANKGVQS